MRLRDIEYREDYRSGHDDLVDDFFRPSLASSRAYWRAVGYFSSSALESFGAPLGEFIKNGGHIRLVTSVELSHGDLEAIRNGAPNFLSDKGVREFNKYAHGGYGQLIEWFDERPRSPGRFLRSFKRKIDQKPTDKAA